jgi:hypothetical protein
VQTHRTSDTVPATIGSAAVSHIGTLGEKPLHAALKRWYVQPGDRIEVPVDGFVIDLVRDDLLIEVQTRGFASIKHKVRTLVGLGHRVRIVHPVPIRKWIVKIDGSGVLSRRKSPKQGDPTDVFGELVSIPDLLAHPRLELELLLTDEEEYRRHSPDRAWRRKGWMVVERRLIEVVDTLRLANPADLAQLLPDDLPDTFTTGDLAQRLGRPRRTAQQMAYCLRGLGAIVAVGKHRNAVLYRGSSTADRHNPEPPASWARGDDYDSSAAAPSAPATTRSVRSTSRVS